VLFYIIIFSTMTEKTNDYLLEHTLSQLVIRRLMLYDVIKSFKNLVYSRFPRAVSLCCLLWLYAEGGN